MIESCHTNHYSCHRCWFAQGCIADTNTEAREEARSPGPGK